MKVAANTVVQFEYLLLADGQVIERTHEHEPQTILIGHAHGLPVGLEALLHGLEAGSRATVHLPPEDAHGPHDPGKVHEVPRSQFPSGASLEVGSGFYTQDANGQPLTARVTAVSGDLVTVDFNHALAGKTLTFEITVHRVRAAEAGELEHGHVHGEGGVTHHHDH